jgi:sigma-B regulation protein RsbU (phosphoserine phosphatase)
MAIKEYLLHSFRLKILALVIFPSFLFILSALIVISVLRTRLSDDVQAVLSEHMNNLYSNIITEYSNEITSNASLRIRLITNELKILATAAQTLIDLGEDAQKAGQLLQKYPYYHNDFVHNPQQNWSNIARGAANMSLSVWGYQHDKTGHIGRATTDLAATGATLKPFMNAMGRSGAQKGWLYLVGPKSDPYMLMYPWAQMPAIFDEKYKGHNDKNWWDFFFPGMVEEWERWLREHPGESPDNHDLRTSTPYYDDAGGTGTMITFFYPLWTPARDANNGAVGIDIGVDALAGIVHSAKIGQSGFAFIMSDGGEVLNLTEEQRVLLGVSNQVARGEGVTRYSTNIFASTIPDIATLKLPPQDEKFRLYTVAGRNAEYYLAVRELNSVYRWNGKSTFPARYFVVVALPRAEVFTIQNAIQKEIATASASAIGMATLAALVIGVLAIALGIHLALRGTKQVHLLMRRMDQLGKGDFHSAVPVIVQDDLGKLARVFNSMTTDLASSRAQLQNYATSLEGMVAERTKELDAANKRLEDLSQKDGLTGLFNRRHFDETLPLLWRVAQREAKTLFLILFDVDYFKQFNDMYGHQAGDDCLRRVASLALGCAHRPQDMVFRYGGEEFVVLLVGGANDARHVSECIRKAVEDEKIPHTGGGGAWLTISLGIASARDFASSTPAALLAQADAALYRSKREGRNCTFESLNGELLEVKTE